MSDKNKPVINGHQPATELPVPLPDAAKARLQSLVEGLTRAGDLTPVTQTEHLKGNTKPPFVDIEDPGYVRSSRKAAEAARAVAEWRRVPQNFEALRVFYSESMQVFVGVPEARYIEGDARLCRVDWSRDETEFRCDMYDVLAEYNWQTPDGMVRKVDIYPVRELPGYGAVLLFDVPTGKLRRPQKRGSRKAQKQTTTPAAPDAGKDGQTEPTQS